MCLSEIDSGLNILDKFKQWVHNKKKKVDEISKDDDNKDNFPYHFNDYTKHITIYKNGNGIIINSFNLVVTDVEKFDKIYRRLNIEDGKKDSKFSTLEKMMRTEKDDRFNKFGFWCHSESNIINGIKEFYWSDTNKTKEDKKIKENPKEIRWYFDFNSGIIQQNKEYKVVYVISIEGMYPIIDGEFDQSINNDPNSVDENETSIEIMQNINNFNYIVSFEDGITLDREPICEICDNNPMYNDNHPVSDLIDYNILFKKHNFNITNPVLGSKIKVSWKFKHKIQE